MNYALKLSTGKKHYTPSFAGKTRRKQSERGQIVSYKEECIKRYAEMEELQGERRNAALAGRVKEINTDYS